LLTTAKMLGGRRSGNVVLAASSRQGGLPIRSLQQSLPADGQMLAGEDLLDFIGEARPLSARQPIAATASGGGS
ncbi:MAG: hypothetical protein JXA67_17270, partial [Micromonosporaceae bacterium]|nr:hypothetical protein [Micromonosporaceae bacterium]